MNQTFKNSYYVQNLNLTALSVYNVGFQKCDPAFSWGPGVRNHYLIHYVVSGKGIYIKNNHVFHLQAGDCFLVYPDEECMYRADEKEPWEYSWVGFAGVDATELFRITSVIALQMAFTPTLLYRSASSLSSTKQHSISMAGAFVFRR